MNQETCEEYLETIYKISNGSLKRAVHTGEIAKKIGVSPPTVTEVLPILEKKGYLSYKPYYGVQLTEDGLTLGKTIVRTHRILEVFLKKNFSMDLATMHEKACQMEHIFDSAMIDELCKKLGAPHKCPDGNNIPKCTKQSCPLENDF
jgi:DtxR family transcriptional regulator, Mn-dependent transcriptional regulator